jgi:hypothetical protein
MSNVNISYNNISARTNNMLMASTDTMGTIDGLIFGGGAVGGTVDADMSITSSTLEIFAKAHNSSVTVDDRHGIIIPGMIRTHHQTYTQYEETGQPLLPSTDGGGDLGLDNNMATSPHTNSRQGSSSTNSKSRASRQSGESTNSSMSFDALSSSIGFDGMLAGARKEVEQEYPRSFAILEEETTSYDAFPPMGQSSMDLIKTLEETSDQQLPPLPPPPPHHATMPPPSTSDQRQQYYDQEPE